MAIFRDDERTREYYQELFEGVGKPNTLMDKIYIERKYLKGISEINKFIFGKWLEIIRQKKSKIKHLFQQEIVKIDLELSNRDYFEASIIKYGSDTTQYYENSNYAHAYDKVMSNYNDILLQTKYEKLKEFKELSFNIKNERLIEYIDELLNFSSQFTKQAPETSSG